jgi:hypothetical protein
MSYKTHILRVKKAGMPYLQTNETTGAVYTVFPYLILSGNSQESIELYLEDQKAKGYEPKTDEASGLYLAFMYNPVPPGSHGLVRTSKGKWIPDMSNIRALDSMAGQFKGLNLGKYLAEAILADRDLPMGMEPVEDQEPETKDTELNPFGE